MSDRVRRRLLTASVCLIALINFAYPLWFHVCYPFPVWDEVKCTLPTVNYFVNERAPLLYLYSNGYMAPITELVAAPICVVLGVHILVVRIIAAIFFAASAVLLFNIARSWYGLTAAFALIIAYTFVPLTTVLFRVIQPPYGLGHVICVALLFIPNNTPEQPSTRRYFFAGMLAGLAYYVFPVCAGYILALFCVLLLADRDLVTQSIRVSEWRNPINLLLIITMGCGLGVFGYRVLTRGDNGIKEWVAGGFAIAASVLLAIRLINNPKAAGRLLMRTAFFAGPLLVIHWLEKMLFHIYTKPQFDAMGIELHENSAGYAWKTWPDWSYQVVNFFERLLPSVLTGRPQPGIHYESAAEIGLCGVLTFLLCFGVSVLFVWRRQVVWAFVSERPTAAMPFLAAFIMVVLLVPSWRLYGDWSLRYLVPYLPGFFSIPFLLYPNSPLAYRCALVLYSLLAVFVLSTYFTVTRIFSP